MTVGVEYFDIVDPQGKIIGRAPRSECHGNPELIHRVSHVLVFDHRGNLLLQHRAPDKDIQPDRWDTSVGGHLACGETHEQAAMREMGEELGVSPQWLRFLYTYLMRSPVETELVATYATICEGPFSYQQDEIQEVRFWTPNEIDASLGRGLFTPNFEEEWQRWREWLREHPDWHQRRRKGD